MAKLLRKLTKLNTHRTKDGFVLLVDTYERTYAVKLGGHKSEMEIPKDATPETQPQCYRRKVHMKEAVKVTFEITRTPLSLLIKKKEGATFKPCRDYEWTGLGLRMKRAPLSDDRPVLSHEQATDISRHLIHIN
jgi:hypothetical protein